MECIEQAYDYAKKAIVIWNDYKMQQIRLETANLRKIEQSRQDHYEYIDEKKALRYKLQKEAAYARWKKNSPDEDNVVENGRNK